MNKKIIYQVISGTVGALIGGILLGYNLLIYGGNNGCFFLEGGYETCATLGLFFGLIIGAMLGLLIYWLIWKKLLKIIK